MKVSLLIDDMILHAENCKDSIHTHKKTAELINEFGKVAGYKVNIKKLHFYIMTMNNLKRKLRNQSHLQ